MRREANRLALPSSFTSASPAKFLVRQPGSFNARESKNTPYTGWRRRSANSATFCATIVIIWASLSRIGFLNQDREAERYSSRLYGEPRAFDCASIENLPYKVMKSALRAKIRSRPSGHSEPIGSAGDTGAYATLSSRFNPALPAFSRTPFLAKDIAVEDTTCAGGR